jgi:DNA helicase-2/ATP-dependent DNA helicase PcrA
MRERIGKLTGFGESTLKDSVSTFHSLAYRLVVREKDALPFALASYPILKDGMDRRVLRDIVRKDLIGVAKAYIGRQRRALIAPPDAVEQSEDQDEAELANAYLEYDKALREEGLLDFDAMVYWAVYILRHSRHALLCENMKWRYVICDEAHDTSPDQKTLAEMLAGQDSNLIWVGDPNQAIGARADS